MMKSSVNNYVFVNKFQLKFQHPVRVQLRQHKHKKHFAGTHSQKEISHHRDLLAGNQRTNLELPKI